jgi:hypothetical protein
VTALFSISKAADAREARPLLLDEYGYCRAAARLIPSHMRVQRPAPKSIASTASALCLAGCDRQEVGQMRPRRPQPLFGSASPAIRAPRSRRWFKHGERIDPCRAANGRSTIGPVEGRHSLVFIMHCTMTGIGRDVSHP